MQKNILTAMLASAFTLGSALAQPLPTPDANTRSASELREFLLAQNWDCSHKTCGQISSCAEACYKLTVCGHRRRDGDNDGIPCENLCRRRCE